MRRRFQKGINSEGNVLGSSPVEGGFCSSESKHGRITAPRIKLFVSASGSKEDRPYALISDLGFCLGEAIFVARKINRIAKRCEGKSCLFWRRDYRKKGQNPSWDPREKKSSLWRSALFVFIIRNLPQTKTTHYRNEFLNAVQVNNSSIQWYTIFNVDGRIECAHLRKQNDCMTWRCPRWAETRSKER
jgi:hypothetical protein